MNYLAHALLSPDDPHVLMGNLWGDLLKPRDYDQLSSGILEGIRRHKGIDAFTDQHVAVEQIVHLLRPYQGKYTPVVADVLMDYMLSRYWMDYCEAPIESFCQRIYHQVSDHLDLIPERLHPRINRMLSHHWLESCKNSKRMGETLMMLSKRASFENTIPDAMMPYELYQEQMDRLFISFFKDIQEHTTLQNADLS